MRIILAGAACLAAMSTWAGVTGVDWGGHYGADLPFTGSRNQSLADLTTSTGDYTFDSVSDAAYIIPFGTVYTPSTEPGGRWVAPDGKTAGPLYTGMMLVNHSSATAPTEPGLYRWDASTNPNQLQKTNPGNGGSDPMSMAVSYFAKKADFLNGLDSAEEGIGFANAVNGASVTLAALRNRNNGTATISFVVQEGTAWYATIATNRVTDAADYVGTLELNPYAADWYAFDPSENQFLNTDDLGTAKAGSTFTNITAFGVMGQSMGYDGTVANRQKIDFSGFTGTFVVIPEPAMVGLLGMGALILMLLRRVRGGG